MPRLRKALCPNSGADVQLDPQHEYTKCSYRGTNSFVETRQRPVTEEARVQQVPVIRIQPVRTGCLEQLLFSLEEFSFTWLPALIHAADAELAIPNGKPSQLIFERDSFGKRQQPVIRIYISSERDGGYVECGFDGQKRRVAK